VLASGRWADITVMDLDPLVVGADDPGRLLRGRILATIVAGKVAYTSPELARPGTR
jgi:predicted amidohydrolase YtcJ